MSYVKISFTYIILILISIPLSQGGVLEDALRKDFFPGKTSNANHPPVISRKAQIRAIDTKGSDLNAQNF